MQKTTKNLLTKKKNKMKINKNIKSLFNLSIFLSKYVWIYFVFLAIASLFNLSNYISSATHSSLLLVCFPLLIIKDLLTARQIAKMAEEERLRFLKTNITFPFRITLANTKFIFDKLITVRKNSHSENIFTDSGTYRTVFCDEDILIIDYYRPEIESIVQVKYLKKDN